MDPHSLQFVTPFLLHDGEPAPGAPTAPPPVKPPVNEAPPQADPAPAKQYDEEYVRKLREEAAGYRTKAKEIETKGQDQMKAIAKALGLSDNGAPDPEALQKELAKRDAQIKNLTLDSRLSETFAKLGAKPTLTRAMLKADGLLDDLDHTAADLPTRLEAAVKKLVDDNPELKVGQVASKGGSSGFNGQQDATKKQLSREDLKGMTSDQIVKAKDDGQLDALMGKI